MLEARRKVHLLCQRYNALPEDDTAGRVAILDALMPDHGKGVYLQGPIQFDFGSHIHMGDGSYANFHFCVLDENQVTIGRNVFIGPYCSIYTPIHPLCWEDRNTFLTKKPAWKPIWNTAPPSPSAAAASSAPVRWSPGRFPPEVWPSAIPAGWSAPSPIPTA